MTIKIFKKLPELIEKLPPQILLDCGIAIEPKWRKVSRFKLVADRINRIDMMMESTDEYLVKEAEFLRNVYSERAKETRLIERYALIAAGAIWSWCATHLDAPTLKLLVWVPPIMTGLFGLRAYAIYRAMITTRNYLATLESKLNLPEGFGWGHHLRAQERGQLYTSLAFWTIAQGFNMVIAFWGGVKGGCLP